jgi:hypothetical protein
MRGSLTSVTLPTGDDTHPGGSMYRSVCGGPRAAERWTRGSPE